MYDNLMLTLDRSLSLDELGSTGLDFVRSGRYAARAFVAPLFALAAFEMAYAVNKRRATRFFFGIKFDAVASREKMVVGGLSSRRSKTKGWRPSSVRYTVWIIAFLLSIVTVIANARYIVSPRTANTTSRFGSRRILDVNFSNFQLDQFVDVVPFGLCLVFLLYVGGTLWAYGTFYSTDVSAHLVNRWSSLTLADIVMIVMWFVSPKEWTVPYLVNGAEVLTLGALVLTMRLIEKNLRTLELWHIRLAGPVRSQVISTLPDRFFKRPTSSNDQEEEDEDEDDQDEEEDEDAEPIEEEQDEGKEDDDDDDDDDNNNNNNHHETNQKKQINYPQQHRPAIPPTHPRAQPSTAAAGAPVGASPPLRPTSSFVRKSRGRGKGALPSSAVSGSPPGVRTIRGANGKVYTVNVLQSAATTIAAARAFQSASSPKTN